MSSSIYEDEDGPGSSVYEQESDLSDSPFANHEAQDHGLPDPLSPSPSNDRLSSLYDEEDGDDILDDLFPEYADLDAIVDMEDEESLFVNEFEEEGPIELPPIQQHFGGLPRSSPMERPHFMRFANFIQQLPMFGLFNNAALREQAPADDLAIVGERQRPLGPLPINIGMRLDYGHNAFRAHQDAGAAPRPTHEPPKAAREGFTRDTGEDVIAICPGCDQELAYDPDGDEDAAPPAKKPRTKKDKAEHHFWAVKACGHVFCRKCYENRKPTARAPAIPNPFRPDPKGTKGKILCVVDDCESEVSNKTAWVGIFL
ncbi:hypothetical protein SLS62_008220 [Diatrype stigma]|uniref:Cell cycle control protein n=1 Tax=Diatrype stigma TaxID=117547 RepID=A0AAN9UKT7_9PEZI